MDQKTIKIAIDDLRERIKKLDDQKKRSEDAIVALQNICEHEFKSDDYKKCKWCGIEQKI